MPFNMCFNLFSMLVGACVFAYLGLLKSLKHFIITKNKILKFFRNKIFSTYYKVTSDCFMQAVLLAEVRVRVVISLFTAIL